jgi:peptidyl-dipeptidase Dcp
MEMRRAVLLVAVACVFLCSFSLQEHNPFFENFDTPFGVPPFDRIRAEHYMPAYEEGMRRHVEEVDAIIENAGPPTFENTLEALEESGAMLRDVRNVFRNLNSAHTNDDIQAIAKEIAPRMSKHFDEIRFNDKLFQRVKAVYERRDEFELTPEQDRLLEKYYKDFIRGGAGLSADKKAELAEINQELSVLSIKFGENLLKENNRFELVIESEDDLAGLPEAVRIAAAEAAATRASGCSRFTSRA